MEGLRPYSLPRRQSHLHWVPAGTFLVLEVRPAFLATPPMCVLTCRGARVGAPPPAGLRQENFRIFNIYHPVDPVVLPLLSPNFADCRPIASSLLRAGRPPSPSRCPRSGPTACRAWRRLPSRCSMPLAGARHRLWWSALPHALTLQARSQPVPASRPKPGGPHSYFLFIFISLAPAACVLYLLPFALSLAPSQGTLSGQIALTMSSTATAVDGSSTSVWSAHTRATGPAWTSLK